MQHSDLPLWLEYVRAIAPAFIAAGLWFAALNYRLARSKSAVDAYQKYSDLMMQVRLLQISDPDIRSIWEDGPESQLEGIDPKHFYFSKILFQANEMIFLALDDPASDTKRLPFNLTGWRGNFRTDLESPRFRRVWEEFEHVTRSYSPKFQREVKSILDEIDRDAM